MRFNSNDYTVCSLHLKKQHSLISVVSVVLVVWVVHLYRARLFKEDTLLPPPTADLFLIQSPIYYGNL